MSEPKAPTNDDASTWLTVAEAAAALDVSEKTIWRRAKAGKIGARKVAGTNGGFVWEIAADATGHPTDRPTGHPDSRPTGHPTDRPTGQVLAAEPIQERERPDNQTEATDRPTDQTTDRPDKTAAFDGITARYVTRLEGENDFLRAALEARDRDAAELRAALREALKMSHRALNEGREPTGKTGELKSDQSPLQVLADGRADGEKSREDAPQSPPNAETTANTSAAPKGAKIERKRGFRSWLLKVLQSE